MKMKIKIPSQVKKHKKKIIVASLAVGAAGILGYFSWQYLKKKKDAKNARDLDQVLKASTVTTSFNYDIPTPKVSISIPKKIPKTSVNTASISQSSGSEFPLQKGSKGENVRLLQEALIAKYGKSILPKYGADGDFGSETTAALKKAGLPNSISESAFNVLTQGAKVDSSSIGADLYKATAAKDFNKAIAALKKIRSTVDYAAANDQFKNDRIGGVHQTIVNGLLSTFTTDAQKQQIKFEFLRMGLQFDGSKWSLSGFDGLPIITTEITTVWVNAKESVKVPPRMVLGNEVTRRLDYTLFENKGKYFLVNTKSVQHL
jgi:peptidoglycan hydrolase-like protein with peptidoglycan-binding domain